jgi:hypothetical protein
MIAPTVSSVVKVTVQVFCPVSVTGAVGVQLVDHPPKAPDPAGDVKVTWVGTPLVVAGYVAVQTDPPPPGQPGPQCSTFAVPVADGAVICQVVVFRPSLYTVKVESSAVASDPGKHEPGVGGWVVGSGKANGQLNVDVAV